MGTLKRFMITRKRKPRVVLSDWFVVRVKAGRERYAARNVILQGHKVLVPWISDPGRPREFPLYPGYIFVKGPQWYYLQRTYGCLAPLMMGESPCCMPLEEMRGLLKLSSSIDDEGTISLGNEKFKKGEGVRVKRGSFADAVGVYIGAVGSTRVRALFEMLGGTHELEFDRTNITHAVAKPKAAIIPFAARR